MAKAKSKAKSPFTGRWRIVSMTEWDEDYINEQVQAFIEFRPDETGDFQFGYVRGEMDCRLTTREGSPAIEWKWEGYDEMDPESGGGWAVLKGEELHGMIGFDDGDESGFVAQIVQEKRAPKRK
jgi:hypothetical protein